MSLRHRYFSFLCALVSGLPLMALEVDGHTVVDGPSFWAAMEGTWVMDLAATRQAGMPVTRVIEEEAGAMYWRWHHGRMQRWFNKERKTDVEVTVEATTPQNITLLIGSPLPPEAMPTQPWVPKWVPTRVTMTPIPTGVMVEVPPIELKNKRYVPWRFYLRRTPAGWVTP